MKYSLNNSNSYLIPTVTHITPLKHKNPQTLPFTDLMKMLNYTSKSQLSNRNRQIKQMIWDDTVKFQGGKTLLSKLLGHEYNTQWLNSVSHEGF